MQIGVLYICIGKYNVFFDGFYKSCEKNFLPEHKKVYYIFTDSDKGYFEKYNNVNVYYQENIGWPDNTLMRFSIFLKAEKDFKDLDYLFFFNANLFFKKRINDDFLPRNEYNLICVKHPCYYDKKISEFPYCRDEKSLAYIPEGKGKYYVQGALNGGKYNDFLELIKNLAKNVNIDKNKGVVALWHDESHLNRYIIDRDDVKIVGPEYVYPEEYKYKFKKVILSRDKKKYIPVTNIKSKSKDFDVVICCAAKDSQTLSKTCKSLKKNLIYKKIDVITTSDYKKSSSDYSVINESDILENLNYGSIKQYFIDRNVKPSRIGWYLQQFLKMAYAFKAESEYYLVWDADTIMLKPIKFFSDSGKIYLDNSRIWEDKIFSKTVESILGYPRPHDFTYIVEHMMINKHYMIDLINYICTKFECETKDFWKKILDCLSNDELVYGGFSEFEVIGTFVENEHRDEIEFRKLNSCRNAKNMFGKHINLFDYFYLRKKYDFASLEKNHEIQINIFKILKHKIRSILFWIKNLVR